MTNEQFWKKLDNIVKKKQTVDTTKQFLKVLLDGYNQNLDILINGVMQADGNSFNQVCIFNEDGRKLMLYYTDYRYADITTDKLPNIVRAKPKCIEANCREVINNALKKEEVDSIVFNHGTPNVYVINKILITFSMLTLFDSPI